jgi:hypothetical protein
LSLARAGVAPLPERIALAEDAVRMAVRSADTAVESAVLAAYCDAIAGPDYVEERIAAADRMVELAGTRRVGALHDQATELLARRLLLVAHLENGDLAAAEEQVLAYEYVAARLAIPLYGFRRSGAACGPCSPAIPRSGPTPPRTSAGVPAASTPS